MKRVDESEHLSIHLSRVRLYRGDVENLIDIITSAGLNLTIGDSAFTYDTLDELKAEKGSEISQLQIKGTDPEGSGVKGISLTLSNRKDAYLSLYGRRPQLEACWYRLRDFLAARHRWHQKLMNPWIAWCFVALAGFFGGILKLTTSLRIESAYLLSFGIAISYWICTLCWARKYPVILLNRQHEHESFWKRNGDKVILLVVGAVIGTVSTLLVKALTSG